MYAIRSYYAFAEIPASSGAPIVRVGDSVTYDLTLNLQEYITQDVAVEDHVITSYSIHYTKLYDIFAFH